MKRKLLTAIFAASMAIALCACGSSSDAPAAPSNPDTVPAYAPSIDELIGSDDSRAPDAEGPVQTTPQEQETEQNELAGVDPQGLILWEQTNPGEGGNPIHTTVYTLDPETGETATVSSFTYKEGTDLGGYYLSAGKYGLLSAYTYGSGQYRFSDDFSKLAIDKVVSSNSEVHAGWIDLDGNFFDVTEALGLQSKSDFDEPVKYYVAGFSDNYFCYYDKLAEAYYYVPVDDVAPATVQAGKPSNLDSVPESRQFAPRDVTSWIDDTHCLINNSYTRQGVGDWVDSVILDTESQTTTGYVPGNSRVSWNGVVNPDGTRIAFMSAPFSYGVNDSNDIYRNL